MRSVPDFQESRGWPWVRGDGRREVKSMDWTIVGVIAFWLLLQLVVLPRLGVPT